MVLVWDIIGIHWGIIGILMVLLLFNDGLLWDDNGENTENIDGCWPLVIEHIAIEAMAQSK